MSLAESKGFVNPRSVGGVHFRNHDQGIKMVSIRFCMYGYLDVWNTAHGRTGDVVCVLASIFADLNP
jgi:hypothetical protein